MWRKCITEYQTQPATYAVYDGDSPAPLSPTTALPGSGIQGAAIPRTLFTLISELPAFDNLGWLTDGVNTTTGNNVDAGLDLDFINGIDPGGRPTGSPFRVFDFNYNPAPGIPPPGDDPTLADYRFGEVVNMFFWTNRYHDRLYELGFTEAAGNFQQNNFGRGGLGNDRVLALEQGFSNTHFSTPPDGSSGRMVMSIFHLTDPDRSLGLDQEVMLHELTHGVSNRLHNNAFGLTLLASRGMGEGWSDFYALSLLAQPGDDPHGIYAVGAYSALQIFPPSTDNYYYGRRRFPHATISTVGPNGKPHNPLTFADLDPAQIDLNDGAFQPALFGDITHDIGEVWCAALWEVRARIIDRMGFDAGSQRTLQLVTDGMKLDPVDPTFLDGRNSILTASCSAFGGEDELDIWAGFAARGMGFSASEITFTGLQVVEAFDMPNLSLGAVTISDDSCSPSDRAPDPGETLTLNIPLSNPFCATQAAGVTVSVEGGAPVSYGNIPAGATVSRDVPFTVPSSAVCGALLTVEVAITSSLGAATRTFNLRIGRDVTATSSFSNTTPILIPGTGDGDITGAPAAPYPSTINVSGVTGTVSRVTVQLFNFNYQNFPDGADILLVGPEGQKLLLMSDAGFGVSAVNADLTFDDAAPTIIDAGVISGVFKPTNIDEEPSDVFPAPAPAGPYPDPQLLSVFNGVNPNGTWSLFVVDDFPIDFGFINSGWRLNITTNPACCSSPCTLNAPSNIVVNNDPGVCGAVVNYPAPTFSGSCGVVTSDPPSGSLFPVGTTTVTVKGTRQDGATTTSSFTVTVNAPTTTTVSSVAGQFSDVVTLKANVTNAVCPGGAVEFKVNGSVVGSAPVVNGAANLPYTISLAQGSYPITATYSSSSPGTGSSGSSSLTVTREDAIGPHRP